VVGLLLVIVAPVLAAIVWEWHTGDTCVWDDGENYWCTENGAFLDGSSDINTSAIMPLPGATNEPFNLVSTCSDIEIGVYWIGHGVLYEGIELDDLPFSMTLPNNETYIYIHNNIATPCYITDVTLGEDDATPTPSPTPTAVEMLDGFTPTSIFSTASDLFNAMTTVIYIVVGITLGFTVLQMILKRLRR